jgi:type IV pilus assembly protein PilP
MKKRRDSQALVRFAALLLVALALAGCQRGMNDLHRYVSRVEAQKGPRLKPIPHMEPYKSYRYDDAALRSPFVPVASKSDDTGIRPDANRNKEYLEHFPLDSLSMVGTIKMGGTRYALVEDNEGLVHRVHKGNYMGQNDGRITGISPSGLTLREIVPNGLGGYVKRQTQVPLATDQSNSGAP